MGREAAADAETPRGSEVSCNALVPVLERLEAEGRSLGELFHGLRYPPSHLKDPRRFISWDAFCTVMERAEALWDADALVEGGRSFLRTPAARFYTTLARLAFSPEDIYRWIARPDRERMFRCVRHVLYGVENGRAVLESRMLPGYHPCRGHLLALRGVLIGIPTVLGLEAAAVEMREIEGGGRFEIRFQRSLGLWGRLRRLVRWSLRSGTATRALENAYEALQAQRRELDSRLLDLERSERALRESEERFERALHGSPIPMVVTRLEDGAVLDFNEAALTAGKFDRDLAGKHWRQISGWKDIERHRRLFELIRSSGSIRQVPISVERVSGEVAHALVSGSLVELGGEKCVVWQVVDDTQRHVAKERLRVLEEAVKQSVDGIAVSDMRGEIRFLNRAWARMHGYDPERAEELVGTRFRIFHSERQYEEQVMPFLRALLGRGHYAAELEHRRRDGETFPVWITATVMRDEKGAPFGVVAVARDLSERKQVEVRLRESQRVEGLRDLAGGIAHDFNNLLAAMVANASLLARGLPADGAEGAAAREIVLAGERAALLTDQLLSYAGRTAPRTALLDLSAEVRAIADLLRSALPKGACLRLELASAPLPVEADPAQLQQAIMNLVTNGGEAIGERGGSVELRTGLEQLSPGEASALLPAVQRPGGSYVALDVRDDGCGIDERVLPRIFDPFYSSKGPGRGLGLSVVAGVVRNHRGGLRIQSREGDGTEVAILLPASEADLPAALRSRDTMRPGSETVLVVDDEPLVRGALQRCLEQTGYRVAVFAEASGAIARLEADPTAVDLVILDLSMPGVTGEQAFASLRAVRPDLPILLVSGYEEARMAARLEGETRCTYLTKPFRLEHLGDALRALLDRDLA